jgi:heme exporter protein D
MPEELFFLFIASCISLWLIQLATESIERRRRIQRGTARERYRGHLILVKAHQEPDTDDWSATAHIQFNQDNLTFRDVHLDRLLNFPTKTSAEKQALKEAKLWVDERLGKA